MGINVHVDDSNRFLGETKISFGVNDEQGKQDKNTLDKTGFIIHTDQDNSRKFTKQFKINRRFSSRELISYI